MVFSMRMMASGLVCIALGVGLFSLVGGCSSGPRKVNITGTITRNGEPLKVSKQGVIEVKFYLQGEQRKTKPAEADPETGKYEIKGIETGKYKITIKQLDPYPTNDLLDGAFAQKNSPVIRDVESDGQVIDVDVGREAANAK